MRHLTEAEQTIAKDTLAKVQREIKTVGDYSDAEARVIEQFLAANPHLALKFITMAHSCNWHGCWCAIHNNAIKTMEGLIR